MLLTNYGIFDHEKFKDIEKFGGFMDERGQRIAFYQPMTLEQQFKLFDFATKEQYSSKKNQIWRKLTKENYSVPLKRFWDKLDQPKSVK